MFVARGPVGVAVDEARIAVLAQQGLDRAGVDVHDRVGLEPLFGHAFAAQGVDARLALGQGHGEEGLDPARCAHLGAEALVGVVVGAGRVAVHEQGGGAVQVDRRRVGEDARTGSRREALAEQEIAVAVHYRDGRCGRASAQRFDHLRIERIGQVVVARPVFEQVAEDVKGLSAAGRSGEKRDALLDDPRPRGREMQIGDEQHRH